MRFNGAKAYSALTTFGKAQSIMSNIYLNFTLQPALSGLY